MKLFSFADKVFVEYYEEFNVRGSRAKFRVNNKNELELYDKDEKGWRNAGHFCMYLLALYPEDIEIVRRKNNEKQS